MEREREDVEEQGERSEEAAKMFLIVQRKKRREKRETRELVKCMKNILVVFVLPFLCSSYCDEGILLSR